MNQLISVIVPVYKVEQYLDRCVQSIVDQTYKNLEIILVDDGSPDNCPAMCDAWAEKDSRIRVIHKANEGVAIARNTALSQAKGTYIGFVDGDDYCFPDMYAHLLQNALQQDVDISMSSYYESDVEVEADALTNVPVTVEKMKAQAVLPQVCIGDYAFGVLWNKLYKASVVSGLEMPPLRCSQDLPYNYFAFKRANMIAISNEQLYFYRNRSTSTTNSKFKSGSFDAIKARDIILNAEKNNPALYPYAIQGYLNANFAVLSGMIASNMFMERFDEVRSNILKYKEQMLQKKTAIQYANRDKAKMLILWLSPKLFIRMTRK